MIYRWTFELRVTDADVARESAPEAKTWKELAEADLQSLDVFDVDPDIRTEVAFEQGDPDPESSPWSAPC